MNPEQKQKLLRLRDALVSLRQKRGGQTDTASYNPADLASAAEKPQPVSSTYVDVPLQNKTEPTIGPRNQPLLEKLYEGARDVGYGLVSGRALGVAGDPVYVGPSGVQEGPEHTENPLLGFLPTTPYDIGEFVGAFGPIKAAGGLVRKAGEKAIPNVAKWAMRNSPLAKALGVALSEAGTGAVYETARQGVSEG